MKKIFCNGLSLSVCCMLVIALSACSRQQSDWQKTREQNTAEAYEQFLKKYPSGEFTAQALARVKEMYEERDWQKTRDADTPEAYQSFLKLYPDGKWTEEARIRVENFTLAQAPSGAAAGAAGAASTLAGAPPSAAESTSDGASATTSSADETAAPAVPPVAVPKGPVSTLAASAKRAAPPATQTATADGGAYRVQLGAFKSGATAAHARWTRLQTEYPTLLAGLSSAANKSASGLYRLQVVGLSESHARALCRRLKAKSQPCLVVPPLHG